MKRWLSSLGLGTIAFALVLLAWIPNVLLLEHPGGDQVWENFSLWSVCRAENFHLGWAGLGDPGVATGGAAFLASWPAGLVYRLSCWLTQRLPLNALQCQLLVGLVLMFTLAAIACRRGGFLPFTSLVVAVLISTAPCAYSRVGHLSLAMIWPVVPALMACHGLWWILLPPAAIPGATGGPPRRSGAPWIVLAGGVDALLCFPAQEYYVFFSLLLLAATYALLLFLATTHTTGLRPLGAMAGRGLLYGVGFVAVLVLASSPRLLVSASGGGPPGDWAVLRSTEEQFAYGLLPFTWLIPSPWIPMTAKALTDSGLPIESESFFASAGSFLIPIAWGCGVWILARRPSPAAGREQRFFALLVLLTTFLGLLWMTMGGLGTLFAAVVTPVLRSLNRYTVFVHGASLLLLASLFDGFLRRRSQRLRKHEEVLPSPSDP